MCIPVRPLVVVAPKRPTFPAYWDRESLRVDFGIRVANAGQIRRPWAGIQFDQQTVVVWLRLESGHLTGWVIDVAKHNRLGGTDLGARRNNFAIAYFSVPGLRRDLDGLDSLDTVGAFFHYAAIAHRHIGVHQHLQTGRFHV